MKQIKVKPSLCFSISTYEERQREQQQKDQQSPYPNNATDRDQADSVTPVAVPVSAKVAAPPVVIQKSYTSPVQAKTSALMTKSHFLSNGKSSPSPPPPPPPEPCFILNGDHVAEISPPIEFADDVPKKITFPPTAGAGAAAATPPTPVALVNKNKNSNNNHTHHPSNSRRPATEVMEKPLTPTPDYDSLIYNAEEQQASVGGNKSTIPPPPPPMQKLNAGSGGPRSTKGPAPPKPNRSVSVTIGEYDSKREPSKLGFLNKGSYSMSGSTTTEMLQNELQMTLSRSNLKKSSDVAKVAAQNGEKEQLPAGTQGTKNSVLEKTGSANVERLTSMLNARNAGSTTVTISIPKGRGGSVQAADSGVKNGILKSANGTTTNGTSATVNGAVTPSSNGAAAAASSNGEVRNIKFDNITTVIGIRK